MNYIKNLKINIHNGIFVFVSLLILFIFTADIANANEKKNLKNNYSIVIPDGWIGIPEKALKLYEKKITKFNPQLPQPEYDFGFRLKNSKNWFDYPYILVQSEKRAPIPEKLLNVYEKYSADKFPSMSDMDVGILAYDQENNVLWMYTESRMLDIGPVADLIGIVLTKKGFVQVSSSSLRDDFKKFEPIFKNLVLSLCPDSGIAYKRGKSLISGIASIGIKWSFIAFLIIVGILLSVKFLFVPKRFKSSSN